MKPIIPLHDPRFRYTNAASTDLRKTFARIRREQERAAEAAKARGGNVRALSEKRKATA